MDEELTGAYRDLVDSALPPADARHLVEERRTQRRRRRQAARGIGAGAGVCAAAVVAVLVLTNGGSDPGPGPADDPTLAAIPAEVTCPEGAQPEGIDFDHVGYDSFTSMLRTEAASNGAFVVDRSSQTIYFLRADGSAHTALTWTGDAQTRWFPGSMLLCQDRQEWSSLSLDSVAPPTPTSLVVGHCSVQPIRFDGDEWEVMREDQFGSGGSVPERFTGAGTVWQTGDVLTYLDHAGTRLTLVPEDGPWSSADIPCR